MRYLALATDYDGVIATAGRPSDAAMAAIQRLRASGRRAILITGRRLDELVETFPQHVAFDCIVAENGALIYEPATRKEIVLAEPPPPRFIERLRELGVDPLEQGRVVVSTWLPHHMLALQAIQELGLELHLTFNRAAVMVLPSGVNKGTGLQHALHRLGLSRHEVVGLGDSENDHSFLQRCECAVAVANAVPAIRQIAALVTKGESSAGLTELVEELVDNDLSRMHGEISKHRIAIGRRADGSEVTVAPYGLNMLIAGPSGSGKSTVAAGFVERLMAEGYQTCIVDPEGDYGTLRDVITIGNQHHAVTVNEVLALLEDPRVTLNVNLLGIPLTDRPAFFGQLFPGLQAVRTRTGRPHWIVLDEAHHMLPVDWAPLDRALPQTLGETLLVTVHPDHLAPMVLKRVDAIIAVGNEPQATISKFARAVGQRLEWPAGLSAAQKRAVVWFPHGNEPPVSMEIMPGAAERIRHHRKYAEGNMRYRSFFFRGPDNRHNLKAQNLAMFSLIADGIDEETWMFHLRSGHYSHWFRDAVHDRRLAEEAKRIERRQDLEPSETRKLIRHLIESRYTLPE